MFILRAYTYAKFQSKQIATSAESPAVICPTLIEALRMLKGDFLTLERSWFFNAAEVIMNDRAKSKVQETVSGFDSLKVKRIYLL